MSLEAEIANLTAQVVALREQLAAHHVALMTVVTGQPGRTQAEIAAETAAAAPAGEKKGPGRPRKDATAPQQAPAAQAAASKPAEASSGETAKPEAAQSSSDDFDPFGEAPASEPARTYNIAEITASLKALHTSGPEGKAAVLKILTSRNVKGVGELKEDQFAKVAEEIRAAGGKI